MFDTAKWDHSKRQSKVLHRDFYVRFRLLDASPLASKLRAKAFQSPLYCLWVPNPNGLPQQWAQVSPTLWISHITGDWNGPWWDLDFKKVTPDPERVLSLLIDWQQHRHQWDSNNGKA